jgi:hypothetical protein
VSSLVVSVVPAGTVTNGSTGLLKAAQIFKTVGPDGEIVTLATLSKAAYHLLDSPLEFQGPGKNIPDPFADFLYNSIPSLGLRLLTPADFKGADQASLLPTYDPQSSFPFHNNFPTTGLISGMYLHDNAAALVARSSDSLFIAFRGTNDTDNTSPLAIAAADLGLGTPDMNDWFQMNNHYNLLGPLLNALNNYIGDSSNQIQHVYVTGHSLGAAMAQRFMTEHTGDSRFEAVTFASPGYNPPKGGDPIVNIDDPRILNIHVDGDPIQSALKIGPLHLDQLRGDDYVISGAQNVASIHSLHDMDLYYQVAQFLNNGSAVSIAFESAPNLKLVTSEQWCRRHREYFCKY